MVGREVYASQIVFQREFAGSSLSLGRVRINRQVKTQHFFFVLFLLSFFVLTLVW